MNLWKNLFGESADKVIANKDQQEDDQDSMDESPEIDEKELLHDLLVDQSQKDPFIGISLHTPPATPQNANQIDIESLDLAVDAAIDIMTIIPAEQINRPPSSKRKRHQNYDALIDNVTLESPVETTPISISDVTSLESPNNAACLALINNNMTLASMNSAAHALISNATKDPINSASFELINNSPQIMDNIYMRQLEKISDCADLPTESISVKEPAPRNIKPLTIADLESLCRERGLDAESIQFFVHKRYGCKITVK